MFSAKLWYSASSSCKKLCRTLPKLPVNHFKYSMTVYEPDYLDSLKPPTPIYEVLNVQLKGYDFPVLENLQKQIHRVIDLMDLDVNEGWATPPRKYCVQRYKPNSSVLDSEYRYPIYERNIQLHNLSSIDYPILLRIIQEMVPEGVTLSVHEPLPEHSEIRYVPDNELSSLRQQLTDLGGPSKKDSRKKKR